MTATTQEINGTELYVEDTGAADLPTVFCLHSLYLDNRMFAGFAAAAADSFRVVYPDFRGQGRSALTDEEVIEMDTYAGDIAALIDELGLGPVHLLVQSMGGDVGLRVAHQRPELVRSIAMLGSSARSEPPEKHQEYTEFVTKFRDHGFDEEGLQGILEIMFGATSRADLTAHEPVRIWQERIAELKSSLAPAMFGVVEREGLAEQLPAIAAPALVISGDEDIARPPEWAQEVADGLPNAELWALTGVGHSPILERPDLIIPRVLEFFAAVDSAA